MKQMKNVFLMLPENILLCFQDTTPQISDVQSGTVHTQLEQDLTPENCLSQGILQSYGQCWDVSVDPIPAYPGQSTVSRASQVASAS